MYISPNLLAIHLNDNGIIKVEDDDLFITILDIFSIETYNRQTNICRIRPNLNQNDFYYDDKSAMKSKSSNSSSPNS